MDVKATLSREDGLRLAQMAAVLRPMIERRQILPHYVPSDVLAAVERLFAGNGFAHEAVNSYLPDGARLWVRFMRFVGWLTKPKALSERDVETAERLQIFFRLLHEGTCSVA